MQQKNVRLQIEHLTTYPLIINSIKKGSDADPWVYFNLETGELSQV
jgi:hypothetical protein